MKEWKNKDEEQQKQDRQKAAQKFLEQTMVDDELRKLVVTDREAAREKLRSIGDIDLPAEVEVICLEPELESGRDNLIVFILPPREADGGTRPIDPMAHWPAAWYPY